MSKSIERYERNARMGAELEKPFNTPHFEPFSGSNSAKVGRASNEYRQAAIEAIRSKFRVVSNALQTNPDTSGGYLIPATWESELVDVLSDENVMRKLGKTITTSGEHKINIAGTKPAALWVAEGGAMTFGNGTFNQISLDAHKVHVGILVTEELLADNAFNLEGYILENFGKAIANAEEDAFINGDGNGKPTGLLTTIAADTTAYNTTVGATISADDIINLVYSLRRPYRKSAVFVLNDSTLASIRKIKDQNQAYMWQPSFTQNEPDRLFGFPLFTTPYMPQATSGSFALAFGDFSYFYIADRGVRSFQELRELYAGNGMVGFLMKERCDAKLVQNEAVRALKVK